VLERWTAAVVRLRVVVLACWLVVLGAGALAATQLSSLLSTSFAVPGTESERAQALLLEHFGERPDGTFVVVFPVAHPSDPQTRRRVERRLDAAARVVPTGTPRELRSGGGVLYGEIVTRLDLNDAKDSTERLRAVLAETGAPRGLVTGQPAIQHDLEPVLASDLRRGEALALPVALAVLVVLFGLSLAVAVPFVFATFTIAGTFAAVAVVAKLTTTTSYVTNLVALLGLALAIDYSLLVVHRFREELAAGSGEADAVARTMATAGRTVAFSGLAVAIGLGLLLFVPVPFIRSMGIAGLLVPLVSIAAALTLQPVLLSLVGARVARRDVPDPERSWWASFAGAIMRRPRLVLVLGTACLIALAAPAIALRVSPGSFSAIPHAPESSRGLQLLRAGVSGGAVTPTHVVVDGRSAGAAASGTTRRAIERLTDELTRDPEVHVVANGRRPPYVDETARFAQVIVAGRHDYGDEESQDFVDRFRHRLVPAAGFPAGTEVVVGGAAAQGSDFLEETYDAFPWLVLAVLLVTYGVLSAAFRSLVLPLEAVLLNLLTVAAAYGVLVAVCQWGVGASLLGLEERGAVEGWIPVFLFATLFGLSMDYEVFLVGRMRESWDGLGDNTRAVAMGLERTGRIVTGAALIMVAAFSGFVAGRVGGLEQLGLGLAVGVLLDATLVRMLLVPSSMALLGRWNWWLPGGARRAPPRVERVTERP
jgi:RND superfamily putative drug exporter